MSLGSWRRGVVSALAGFNCCFVTFRNAVRPDIFKGLASSDVTSRRVLHHYCFASLQPVACTLSTRGPSSAASSGLSVAGIPTQRNLLAALTRRTSRSICLEAPSDWPAWTDLSTKIEGEVCSGSPSRFEISLQLLSTFHALAHGYRLLPRCSCGSSASRGSWACCGRKGLEQQKEGKGPC